MSLNIQEKDPVTGELKRKVVAGVDSSVIDDTDMQSTTTTLSAKKISDSLIGIKDDLGELASKGITLFICDSFGDTDTDAEGITEFYPHCFAKYSGLTLNDDFFFNCEDGGGFAQAGIHGKTFKTLVEELALNESFNNNEVKNIIVAGGWNDFGQTTANMNVGIKSFAETVKNSFPNAQIHLAMTSWSPWNPTAKNGLRDVILPCYKSCASISMTGNIRYIPNTEYINHDYSKYSSDGVHPSKEGYDYLGKHLANAYRNGISTLIMNPSGVVKHFAEYTIAVTNEKNVLNCWFKETIDSFIITRWILDEEYTNGGSKNYRNFIKVADLSNDITRFIRCFPNSANAGAVMWWRTPNYIGDTTTGKWYVCDSVEALYNKELQMFVCKIPGSDSSKWDYFKVNPMTMVIDKLYC